MRRAQRPVPQLVFFLNACAAALLLGTSTPNGEAADAASAAMGGEIRFVPTAAEPEIAERFRLASHTFAWEGKKLAVDSPTVAVWDVMFPSPVVTPHAANNTVHCEYYYPLAANKQLGEKQLGEKQPVERRPAAIVLHILGGDFALSRVFCNYLAQHGVAALFVKMPYYGPRRDPESSRRMISLNPGESVAGMTQAVLDIRRATAWLAARDEVDPDQLGIFGISLGGITGALAATSEPRLQNVCLLLAGGDMARVPLDSPEIKKVRAKIGSEPVDLAALHKELALIDPVTYAAGARGKRILMLNAKDDEVIPRACTESLWKAFGEPEISWYSGGHYTVAWHMFSALDRVALFFTATHAATRPAMVAKSAAPLVIDGRLDEPAWREARPISVNRRLGEAGLVTEPAPITAKLTCDERCLYIGYEARDPDCTLQLFLSLGSPEEFWQIDHAVANKLTSVWCRVPSQTEWVKQGKPRDEDVRFDRERHITNDGKFTLASAVLPAPQADGKPSANGNSAGASFTGELRLPWQGIGLPAPRRRADGSYDLSGLELSILTATRRGDAAQAAYHSSAELPKQPFPFSANRWPRYRFASP